jgi:DNA-binding CsgD family transcriptional regulator
VGREAELAALQAGLRRVAEGHSQTVVVTGATGVGKTALVRAALDEPAGSRVVLAGACLPLRRVSVPLLPLRAALREARPPGHERCLEQLEVVDRAPRALDEYVDTLAASGPVILFVDDIQWADRTTLDVLLYLAAGPSDRPLAVLVSARDDGLPDGHPLHSWLADVERLPRVTRLRVRALDRPGTERQVATILGAAPHQGLVDEVFARARGNPYLTSLLVRGLTATARALPDDLPTDLAAAVRRDWHELSEPARRVTSLVAVAGRPVAPGLLQTVADDLAVGAVQPGLQEAADRRLLRLADPDHYWFDHPLQAEVLAQDLEPPRRRAWHAAYARALEAGLAAQSDPELATAVALSDHHEDAGDLAAAYAWALRSWSVAGPARGSPELRRLLRRAIELRPSLPDAAESRQELLERLRGSAEAAAAFADELAAVDALLETLDEDAEPLAASTLLVRRSRLRTVTGAGTPDREEAGRAVVLAARAPDSWQHATALAELTRAEVWAADPRAREHAQQALDIARRAGHRATMAQALLAGSMAAVQDSQPAVAVRRTAAARRLALPAGDWNDHVAAAIWEHNATTPPVTESAANRLRLRRQELATAGAPHVFVAMLAATEAESRLLLGDWAACRDLLRVTLGSDLGAFVDVRSRLTAAMLDAWQGRSTQARMHLDRARELLAGSGNRHASLPLATTCALVDLASGRPRSAHRAALAGARATGAPPHLCEWLVPLAARALADLAEAAVAGGNGPAHEDTGSGQVAADVESLVAEFPRIVTDVELEVEDLPQLGAMQAWYDAEVARARHDGDLGERWWSVAEAAEVTVLPWVAGYAWSRAAEAHLTRGREQRRQGIAAWRRARDLTDRLGTVAIADELGTLARIARVPQPRDPGSHGPVAAGLPGVTPREREILAQLMAGSTYAEIAAHLVISEKTVSSHVSNLLRKTGTANRVELSRLVARAGLD